MFQLASFKCKYDGYETKVVEPFTPSRARVWVGWGRGSGESLFTAAPGKERVRGKGSAGWGRWCCCSLLIGGHLGERVKKMCCSCSSSCLLRLVISRCCFVVFVVSEVYSTWWCMTNTDLPIDNMNLFPCCSCHNIYRRPKPSPAPCPSIPEPTTSSAPRPGPTLHRGASQTAPVHQYVWSCSRLRG